MKTSVLFVAALVLATAMASAADKMEKKAPAPRATTGEDDTKNGSYFGDSGYTKTEASKDLKARPVDRDSFMSLHPRAYDHNAQPYTINPYRKPSATYYRVSPFDNANSYFKGTKAF